MQNIQFWEEWNEKSSPSYPHEKAIQFVLRNFKGDNDEKLALDLGCGSGIHTELLLERGFSVIATDISETAIIRTNKRIKKFDNSKYCTFVSSIDQITFIKDSLDLVICVGVIDCAGFDASKIGINHAFSLLRPGGKFFALFAHVDDFRKELLNNVNFKAYNINEVKKLFDQAWKTLNIDFYITTYNSQSYMQKDFLITSVK